MMIADELKVYQESQTSFYRAVRTVLDETERNVHEVEPLLREYLEERGFRFYMHYNPITSQVVLEVKYKGEFYDAKVETGNMSKGYLIEVYTECFKQLDNEQAEEY